MRYVNLTPRWTEILPTWLMMFEQAITGDCTDPDLVRENAKAEFRRMAEAADKWNDHSKFIVAINHFTAGELTNSQFISCILAAERELMQAERGEDHA